MSGLPDGLLGTRLRPGSPGTPDPRNTRLPGGGARPRGLRRTRAGRRPSLRSLVVVPLVAEGRLVGSLAAASAVPDGFTDDQAAELQRFADTVALAADRARLQASERERRGWLSFIADAGDLLAGSLDQDMTMAITGQIVVPAARAVVRHPPRRRARQAGRCSRSGTRTRHRWSRLRPAVEGLSREQLVGGSARRSGSRPPASRWSPAADGSASSPWVGPRGALLGSEFYLVAESIARRAALAIDNARAHGDLQAVGKALQDSLLPPSRAAGAPGFDVGVVYEPAGEDASGRWGLLRRLPARRGHLVLRRGRRLRHRRRGRGGHRLGQAHDPGAGARGVPGRRDAGAAEHGDPRRGRARPLPHPGLRDAPPRGRQVRLDLVNAGHPPPFLVGRRRERPARSARPRRCWGSSTTWPSSPRAHRSPAATSWSRSPTACSSVATATRCSRRRASPRSWPTPGTCRPRPWRSGSVDSSWTSPTRPARRHGHLGDPGPGGCRRHLSLGASPTAQPAAVRASAARGRLVSVPSASGPGRRPAPRASTP